jgi:hypothetical protein
MADSTHPVYVPYVDPEALKLSHEIEASRQEIEKLQQRVKQLVARRGKRAELVKSAQILSAPERPAEPSTFVPSQARSADDADVGHEYNIEEGLAVLKATRMSDVRLIAFKHGAVIFLFADEKTLTVRMDERGPKPLLDLLTANDHKSPDTTKATVADTEKRPRA